MCMNPLPIFHRSSVGSSGVISYGVLVSKCEVSLGGVRTYSHVVEVSFDFPSDLIDEFAT